MDATIVAAFVSALATILGAIVAAVAKRATKFKIKGIELSESKITILGYAFLENSDDTRNTPAYPLFKSLNGLCKEVVIHDPHVRKEEGLIIEQNLDEAINNSDCIAIVTKHKEYYDINLNQLKSKMRTPIIIDGRNVFNKNDVIDSGFVFRGIGVGTN